MEGKDALKYGLIAIGAYLLYQYLKDQGMIDQLFGGGVHTPLSNPDQTPVTTQQPAQTTVQQPVTLPANPVTTRELVKAAADADGFTFGNVYQWDFYYKKVRGVDADLGKYVPEEDKAKNLTFDEWWAFATSHGLSSLDFRTTHVFPQTLQMQRWLM